MTVLEEMLHDKIVEMYHQGMGYRAISRELNVSLNTVRKFCVMSEDEIAEPTHKIHLTEEDKDAICDMYLNQGMTPTNIAEHFRCSNKTINRVLFERGLENKGGKKGEWGKLDAYTPLKAFYSDGDTCFYPKRDIKPKKYTDVRGKAWSDVTDIIGG